VHLRVHSISRSPSASPNLLDPGLQVHLWVHSITVSKCFSQHARSRPPSESLSSLNSSLQVLLDTPSITVSNCIFKERQRLYGDRGVTEVARVTGSIYSADRGLHRHHLISISSYHTMKLRTLSFLTSGLTDSVRNFMDGCNCVDPQHLVVSYLLI